MFVVLLRFRVTSTDLINATGGGEAFAAPAAASLRRSNREMQISAGFHATFGIPFRRMVYRVASRLARTNFVFSRSSWFETL